MWVKGKPHLLSIRNDKHMHTPIKQCLGTRPEVHLRPSPFKVKQFKTGRGQGGEGAHGGGGGCLE